MPVTIADIRFTVERNVQDTLENESVIHWCNVAQSEFMLRVKIPGNTTLAVDTSTLEYNDLPDSILEFRRFRWQSDIDNGYNRQVYPIYSWYNGKFEVPVPFPRADDLLIDYYAYLTDFTEIDDEIDLLDRFKPLYTTYIESVYYNLPSTREKIGELQAQRMYERAYAYYNSIKKQVMDFYIVSIGTQKPSESGW